LKYKIFEILLDHLLHFSSKTMTINNNICVTVFYCNIILLVVPENGAPVFLESGHKVENHKHKLYRKSNRSNNRNILIHRLSYCLSVYVAAQDINCTQEVKGYTIYRNIHNHFFHGQHLSGDIQHTKNKELIGNR